MDKFDLILEVLKKINSYCAKCKGTGLINVNGNKNLCDCCDGKGYHNGKELIDEIKIMGATPRQEEKEK